MHILFDICLFPFNSKFFVGHIGQDIYGNDLTMLTLVCNSVTKIKQKYKMKKDKSNHWTFSPQQRRRLHAQTHAQARKDATRGPWRILFLGAWHWIGVGWKPLLGPPVPILALYGAAWGMTLFLLPPPSRPIHPLSSCSSFPVSWRLMANLLQFRNINAVGFKAQHYFDCDQLKRILIRSKDRI